MLAIRLSLNSNKKMNKKFENFPKPENDKQYGIWGVVVIVLVGIEAILKMCAGADAPPVIWLPNKHEWQKRLV